MAPFTNEQAPTHALCPMEEPGAITELVASAALSPMTISPETSDCSSSAAREPNR
jgi:hypothetical protein